MRGAALDDDINVTFSIEPVVRTIRYHEPEKLSLEEYFFEYYYSSTILLRDTGEAFADYLRRNVRVLVELQPGERHEVSIELQSGYLVGSPHFLLKCKPAEAGAEDPQVLEFKVEDGQFHPSPVDVTPGIQQLALHNGMDRAERVFLHFAPDIEYFSYSPYLSGKQLLCTQSFRRLFNTEVVRAADGIGVNDITLLFSDLKDSTAMYERIGDQQAFQLVSEHFECLAKTIARCSGAVVKTMGDAIMASFADPTTAVAAALLMTEEIVRLDCGPEKNPLGLKIGIHRGSAIAVTCNDTVDFFGTTVNISARVQGTAGRNEICITEEVYAVEEVQALLTGHKVTREINVTLKGVAKPIPIYRIV